MESKLVLELSPFMHLDYLDGNKIGDVELNQPKADGIIAMVRRGYRLRVFPKSQQSRKSTDVIALPEGLTPAVLALLEVQQTYHVEVVPFSPYSDMNKRSTMDSTPSSIRS